MRHTLLLACVVLAILLSSISLALQIRKQQDEGFNLVKYGGANATELEVLLARVDLMALREIVPCTDGVCPPAYYIELSILLNEHRDELGFPVDVVQLRRKSGVFKRWLKPNCQPTK